MKVLFKYFILFNIGGLCYIIIELLWRGFSHWSMFFLGGSCFVVLGLINERASWDVPLIAQMAAGAFIITALEFIAGCVLNIWLDMNVWSYADMPYNIMGQICLPYTVLWFFMSGLCIAADDWIRYLFFEEEKPHYKII